jgi:hypothetical protein
MVKQIIIAKEVEKTKNILAFDFARVGRLAPIAFPTNAAALSDSPYGKVSSSSPIETTRTYAASAFTSPVDPAISTRACILKLSKNSINVPGIARNKYS